MNILDGILNRNFSFRIYILYCELLSRAENSKKPTSAASRDMKVLKYYSLITGSMLSLTLENVTGKIVSLKNRILAL